jgi:hypothetical protein
LYARYTRWRWDHGGGDDDAAVRKLQLHCRQGEHERPAIDHETTIVYDDADRAEYDRPRGIDSNVDSHRTDTAPPRRTSAYPGSGVPPFGQGR